MPLENCPACGFVLKEARSPRHHRFYFRAIHSAFHQWNVAHSFQPDNAEHLRHWLQVQAGHYDLIAQNQDGDLLTMADFASEVLDKARRSGSAGFIEIAPDKTLVAKFPKTVNWSISQAEFKPVADAVFALIEQELGVSVDELKKEAA